MLSSKKISCFDVFAKYLVHVYFRWLIFRKSFKNNMVNIFKMQFRSRQTVVKLVGISQTSFCPRGMTFCKTDFANVDSEN